MKLAPSKSVPLTVNLAHESDDALIVRTAWLYYMGGFNQEETAARLGLHRTRVNRLLAEARERGLVSITIQHESARELQVEHAIAQFYGLDFCLATPAIGFEETVADPSVAAAQSLISRRAVGSAGANFLRGKLSHGPITIGVSWGRTVEQVALHLAGVRNSEARFVSLMGSLTRNSASNPFEVVQALAARTGGEGHFLPVPFIADTEADRDVLMSQRSVADSLRLAHSASLYLVSAGELTEDSSIRTQNMISAEELQSARASGAVCDTLGKLFDIDGHPISHSLNRRTLAIEIEDIRGRDVVLLSGGLEKVQATNAVLRSGLIRGLIIDGDSARLLAKTYAIRPVAA
jgi:DNA-binding transcriptional regulator LsrR (DeoR family)